MSPRYAFAGTSPSSTSRLNHELVKLIERDVRAAPEDVEDACSYAWIQFFRYQRDRERNWKGWLYRTAQRETWNRTSVGAQGSRPIRAIGAQCSWNSLGLQERQ